MCCPRDVSQRPWCRRSWPARRRLCGARRRGGRRICRVALRRARRGAPRCRSGDRRSKAGVLWGDVGFRRVRRGALRVPVWRPAFQGGGAVGRRGVSSCAARSAARAGLETGVPRRGRCGATWGFVVRSAERCACRSGDRRSKAGAPWGDVGFRRVRRGALRVPVWRPAFQGGGAVGRRGVSSCAARSAARAGLETGVPRRGRRGATWGFVVCGAERCACRSGDRRSKAVRQGAERRCPLEAGVSLCRGYRAAACGGDGAGVLGERADPELGLRWGRHARFRIGHVHVESA